MVWVFFLRGVGVSCCTLGCGWLLMFGIGVVSVFLGWVLVVGAICLLWPGCDLLLVG